MLDTGILWHGVHPDRAEPKPIYRAVADRIALCIAEGSLRPGDALPAERDLAHRLRVSRTTVRRAFEELAVQGMVTSRPGSGTYVAERFDQPLARLTSFTEDVRARGGAPQSLWLERQVRQPLPEEALALALGVGESVTSLARVRLADGERLAVERAVVPARLLPDPCGVTSLYAALGPHAPVRALQRMRAATIGPEDARHLGMEPGSPAMATVRHGYAADGRPVEFTRALHRGDRYDFIAEMRRG